MSEKLMYVYGNDEVERAAQRVCAVQALGFEVIAISNLGEHTPEDEDDLRRELREECVGLWVDLVPTVMGDRTRQFVIIAADTGKNLLGRVHTDERIDESLRTFFGSSIVEAITQ